MTKQSIVLITKGKHDHVMEAKVILIEQDMSADRGYEEWRAEEYCEATNEAGKYWTKAEIIKEGEIVSLDGFEE